MSSFVFNCLQLSMIFKTKIEKYNNWYNNWVLGREHAFSEIKNDGSPHEVIIQQSMFTTG